MEVQQTPLLIGAALPQPKAAGFRVIIWVRKCSHVENKRQWSTEIDQDVERVTVAVDEKRRGGDAGQIVRASSP